MLVLVPRRIDFGYQSVEVWIGSETPLRNELLATSGTFFVARAESRNDALLAESVETLFGGHGCFQNIQTDGTHQLRMKRSLRHRYFGGVCANLE